MEKPAVYVGLDYHQDAVQACVMDAGGRMLANIACVNDCVAIVRAVERHGVPRGVAVEACAGAANLADELIAHAGWAVDLAHPGYVARLKQSPDKTDFADARILADLTRVGWLPRVWLAPEPVRALRRLTRWRQTIVDDRRAARLRVRALLRDLRRRPPRGVRPWTAAWRAWLDALELPPSARFVLDALHRHIADLSVHLRAVEAELDRASAADQVVARLLAMPGIGRVTAWVLRAQIGRFDRFRTGKQLARFCSLCPRNASSGERVADSGLIRAGDPQLRATLIELGHRLARHDPRWGELAARLRAAGKHACVVAAAIANRFVRWLHHQMQETPRMT